MNRIRIPILYVLVVVSIPTLLLVIVLDRLHEARLQKTAIAQIQELAGSFWFEHECLGNGVYDNSVPTPGPVVLHRLLGEDFFRRVVELRLGNSPGTADERIRILSKYGERHPPFFTITDEHMAIVATLNSLRVLDISFSEVTDVGLKRVANLKQLRELNLSNTRITSHGVDRIRKALPNCTIIGGHQGQN